MANFPEGQDTIPFVGQRTHLASVLDDLVSEGALGLGGHLFLVKTDELGGVLAQAVSVVVGDHVAAVDHDLLTADLGQLAEELDL